VRCARRKRRTVAMEMLKRAAQRFSVNCSASFISFRSSRRCSGVSFTEVAAR
jgi:hypothetical protein